MDTVKTVGAFSGTRARVRRRRCAAAVLMAVAFSLFMAFGLAGAALAASTDKQAQDSTVTVSFTTVWADGDDPWSQRPTTYYMLQARMRETGKAWNTWSEASDTFAAFGVALAEAKAFPDDETCPMGHVLPNGENTIERLLDDGTQNTYTFSGVWNNLPTVAHADDGTTYEIAWRAVETRAVYDKMAASDDKIVIDLESPSDDTRDTVTYLDANRDSYKPYRITQHTTTSGNVVTSAITNTLSITEHWVFKFWEDEDNAWVTRPGTTSADGAWSTTFLLQRSTDDGTTWKWLSTYGAPVDETDLLDKDGNPNANLLTVTLSGENSGVKCEDLPAYDPKTGLRYTYRAVEVVRGSYSVEGGEVLFDHGKVKLVALDETAGATVTADTDGDGTVSLRHYFYNQLQTTTLAGTKYWLSNGRSSAFEDDDSPQDSGLTLELQRTADATPSESSTWSTVTKTVKGEQVAVQPTWTQGDEAAIEGTDYSDVWTFTYTDLPACDQDGNAYTYRVVEVDGSQPGYYAIYENGNVTDKISETQQKNQDIINAPARFTFDKLEADDGKSATDETAQLNEVELEIFDEQYELVATWQRDYRGNTSITYGNNSSQRTYAIDYIAGLPSGTYKVHEVFPAPYGHLTVPDFDITISADGTVALADDAQGVTVKEEEGAHGTTVFEFDLADPLLRGTFSIEKYYLHNDTECPVEGMTFDLYSDPNPRDGDNGTLIATGLTTDAQGMWTSVGNTACVYDREGVSEEFGSLAKYYVTADDGLPEGDYRLVETGTSAYTLNAVGATFDFKIYGESDPTIQPEPVVVNVSNDEFSGEISLSKTDAADESVFVDGAGFTLYWQPESVGAEAVAQYTQVVSGLLSGRSYTLNGDMTGLDSAEGDEGDSGVLVLHNLKKGAYKLVETSAAPGYTLCDDEDDRTLTFTVSEVNKQPSSDPDSLGLTNTKTSLMLAKASQDHMPLAGAEFTVTPARGSAFADGSTAAKTFAVDGSGIVVLEGELAAGNAYVVRETAAPAGYEVSAESMTVTLDAKGAVSADVPAGSAWSFNAATDDASAVLALVDTPTSLTLAKVSAEDGSALTDTTFIVAPQQGSAFVDGSTAAKTLDVDENGLVILTGELVANNSYTAVECAAPHGYVVSSESALVSMDNFGKPQIGTSHRGGWSFDGNTATLTLADELARTSISPSVSKSIDGRAWATHDSFSFSLRHVGSDEVVATTTATYNQDDPAASGQATFSPALTFTLADLEALVEQGGATYDEDASAWYIPYVIEEGGTTIPGIATADDTPVMLRVVQADDGSLSAAFFGYGEGGVDYGQAVASFAIANSFTDDSVAAAPRVHKRIALEGAAPTDEQEAELLAAYQDKFSLNLAAAGATLTYPNGDNVALAAADIVATLPTGGVTARNDATGNVQFGDITITRAMLRGAVAASFQYKVTEAAGSLPGMSYSAATLKFTIKVTDSAKDGLQIVGLAFDEGATTFDTALTFSNTFEPEDVSATPSAYKVVEASAGNDFELTGGEFSFTLTAVSAPAGIDATATFPDQSKTNGVVGNAALAQFDELTFTRAGTYVFQMNEDALDKGNLSPDEQKAFSHDDTVYTVTYTVGADYDSGELYIQNATISPAPGKGEGETYGDRATFTNGYEPASTVSANVYVTKTVVGAANTGGSFTFTLTPNEDYGDAVQVAGEDGMLVNLDTGSLTATVSEQLADGQTSSAVAFPQLTFTAPSPEGGYTFTVAETSWDDTYWTCSTGARTVTFYVRDDGKGGLVLSGDAQGTTPFSTDSVTKAFTNTHDFSTNSSTTGAISIKKVLTGRTLAEGEFSFELRYAGTDEQRAYLEGDLDQVRSNVADGTVSFDSITFKTAGTYTFEVAELGADGGFATGGTAGNVTYSADVYNVVATVTRGPDMQYQLTWSITRQDNGSSAGQATFNNSHNAVASTDVVIEGSKVLHGSAFDAEAITEQVKQESQAADAKSDAETDKASDTKTDGSATAADANADTKDGTDTGGDSETDRDGSGTDTDGTAENQNHDGSADDDQNTESDQGADNDQGGADGGQEAADGGQGGNGDQGADESTEPGTDDSAADSDGSNDADGDADYADQPTDEGTNLENAEADLNEGQTVQDDEPEQAEQATSQATLVDDGIVISAFSLVEPNVANADEATEEPEVNEPEQQVADGVDAQTETDADSNQQSATTGDEGTDPQSDASDATDSPTDADLQAKIDQALEEGRAEARSTDRALEAGEFTFTLTFAGREDLVVATATNQAGEAGQAASVIFPALRFTTEYSEGSLSSLPWLVNQGLAASGVDAEGHPTYTLQLTATEDADELLASITPNVATFAVSVTLTDDLAGNLTANVTYPDGGMAFENSYDSAVVRVQGVKALAGTALSGGEFGFTLYALDGGPMPTKAHATNDASGTVDFGEILFDAESSGLDEAGSRTFTYEVTEDATDALGVIVDSESKYFTITVTRAEDGTFAARCEPSSGSALFTFKNSYVSTPVDVAMTSQLSLTETLTGRAQTAGEFSFEMYELDSLGNRVSAEPVATGTNAADGTVTMSEIRFIHSGVYRYEVVEVAGDQPGIAYDSHVARVRATVVEDVAGATLLVKWSVEEGSSLEFVNTYTPTPATAQIVLTKELTGADLEKGQFTFTLTPEGGPTVAVANDTDGTVTFPELTFTQAGTYAYTVAEVNDGQKNVTYDADSERTVVIEVTDDGQGQLHASISGDSLTFENSYKEPAPEPTLTPEPTPTPESNPMTEPTPTSTSTPSDATPKTDTTTGAQIVKTADESPDAALLAGVALTGVALTAVGAYALRRRMHD